MNSVFQNVENTVPIYEKYFEIAFCHFSSMSFLNFLILSMHDLSCGDGWNDLSMSIGVTR